MNLIYMRGNRIEKLDNLFIKQYESFRLYFNKSVAEIVEYFDDLILMIENEKHAIINRNKEAVLELAYLKLPNFSAH